MVKYLKNLYKQLVYLTSFTVCSGDIKKKALKKTRLKMTSQLVLVIFRAFFSFFFRPPTLNLEKNPVNQLIKNSGLNMTNIWRSVVHTTIRHSIYGNV